MKLKETLKKIRGNPVFQFKIFGIPLICVAKPSAENVNIFLLYIPFLRIITSKTRFGLNILILAWIMDFVNGLNIVKENGSKKLRCNNHVLIEYMNSPHSKGVKILGKNLYTVTVKEPYKFPNTAFKG